MNGKYFDLATSKESEMIDLFLEMPTFLFPGWGFRGASFLSLLWQRAFLFLVLLRYPAFCPEPNVSICPQSSLGGSADASTHLDSFD